MYEELIENLRFNARQVQQYGSAVWKIGTEVSLFDAANAIEELSKRIDFLMNCIYEAEDALDRGADNEWARAALKKAEEKLREIPVTKWVTGDEVIND